MTSMKSGHKSHQTSLLKAAGVVIAALSIQSAAAQDARKGTSDPSACFEVQIEGFAVATFQDIETESDAAKNMEIANRTTKFPPGSATLKLTRHYDPGRVTQMNQWFDRMREGQFDRQDIVIKTLDTCRNRPVIARYPQLWSMKTIVSGNQSSLADDQLRLEVMEVDVQ